ncbi:MAG TPA: SDR family oxidoreductase [Deltaproteobacteria bacterium]|nr:SDR family oxidoreductase [Deltaproteobacteria bacterium]
MAEQGISLVGKTALITGGSKGIGKSIALTFANQGADIVIASRSMTLLEEVTQKIYSAGGKCLPVEADVIRLVEASRSAFGKVDILVNNAGVSKELPFMELSLSDWDQMLSINLMGVLYCIRAVLPKMRSRREGTIINIASAAGLRGLPGSSAYSASKAAVIALTQSLGDEVGPDGIRVNVICPGPIKTEMLDQSAVKNFLIQNPNDLLKPDAVAGAALFLASSLSGGMNSQVLVVRTKSRW